MPGEILYVTRCGCNLACRGLLAFCPLRLSDLNVSPVDMFAFPWEVLHMLWWSHLVHLTIGTEGPSYHCRKKKTY